MSDLYVKHAQVLADLRRHLQVTGYCATTIEHQCAGARQFLCYLQERGIQLEAVKPPQVAMYMRRKLRNYLRRHGRMPTNRKGWRTWCTDGVVQLLRLTHTRWPPPRPARSSFELFARSLCSEYGHWLEERRALASGTIEGHLEEARRFLAWYERQCPTVTRLDLSLAQIDGYVRSRATGLRRTTLKTALNRLRSFLRFLHGTERTSADLSGRLITPMLYQFESIPAVLQPEEIERVLRTARRDRSAKGKRDFAILTLLATYGLRAGEVVRLTLEDIDWRAETLLVRHSKTRGTTVLPLLPAVGKALLDYLQGGRPKTRAREVFIRTRAPLRGFSRGSSLHGLVRRRIAAAGVRPPGKRGPHVFRHAHAVALLRAAVPLKTISDLLGHRASASTAIYLKLNSEELRAVALPLPGMEGTP